jgi:hypothetical protein
MECSLHILNRKDFESTCVPACLFTNMMRCYCIINWIRRPPRGLATSRLGHLLETGECTRGSEDLDLAEL